MTAPKPRQSRLDVVSKGHILLDDRARYIPFAVREHIAQFFRAFGARPNYSSDVGGEFTAGYGDGPDELGYWEYQLP